jgi:hypothetical protein
MARRLLVLALGAAAVAAVAASRRRARTGDPQSNGGARGRTERLRRETHARLRDEITRARTEES